MLLLLLLMPAHFLYHWLSVLTDGQLLMMPMAQRFTAALSEVI
jgi:hypothetical protein